MPSFTPLPIENGFGDWDLNRFRIVFRLPPNSTQTLTGLVMAFTTGFQRFFKSPAATVETLPQGGETLYRFHGNLKVLHSFYGSPHPDWVKVIWSDPMRGFTVQTLHRDTPDSDDAAMSRVGTVVGVGLGAAAGALTPDPGLTVPIGMYVGAEVGALSAFAVNRYHFLAGRRSWLLQAGPSLDGPNDPKLTANDFVLETAAIERISIWPLYPMKLVLWPSIRSVWTNLLANFVADQGLQSVPYPPEAGWALSSYRGLEVHYMTRHFLHKEGLLGSAEGSDVVRKFRHVWG